MTLRGGRRGRYVAIEGIDGAGKTTLVRALARLLRRRGVSVAVRREPNDARLGRLAQRASVGDPWAGAVYFTLDRILARPSLEADLNQHDLVLTDRSFYSTLAYQGSAIDARGRRRLEAMQRTATRSPDRVFLLRLAPPDALARLGRRGGGRGPLERRRTLVRVDRAYSVLAARSGWRTLDARRDPHELARDVAEGLGPALGGRGRGRRPARR